MIIKATEKEVQRRSQRQKYFREENCNDIYCKLLAMISTSYRIG
jgi:hypothetical protein